MKYTIYQVCVEPTDHKQKLTSHTRLETAEHIVQCSFNNPGRIINVSKFVIHQGRKVVKTYVV